MHCGLIYHEPELKPGEKARCARCRTVLMEKKRHGLSYPLALAISSLFLFILSNVYPLLKLKIAGREQSGLIFTGINELYQQGFWAIAALVFMVAIIAPLLRILSVLYVLLPLLVERRWPKAKTVFRLVETLQPWAMSEVFMLGILVALVKLGDLATIELGTALYSFAALIVLMTAMDASLDDQAVWEQLSKASE